jgi:carbamate kinase
MAEPTKPRPVAILAMGGHAFIAKGEKGTISDHERNAARIATQVLELTRRGYSLVVTHGNGPQVGFRLLQTELARKDVPAMPLDVLVADTEGQLGYILQQAFLNDLRRRGEKTYVVTVITQVLVDSDDPAMQNPTKPIGPFYSEEEAQRRAAELNWKVIDDAGRGWRRVVPSPQPRKVIQRDMIREAAHQGHIVIACGGGGIPVKKLETQDYEGVEAVIDKDLTSALLASQIGAELFIILTDVDKVYLNYRKPNQIGLDAVTIQLLEQYIVEGHFPAGSMGPKMEAVRLFLSHGGRRAIITDPDHLYDALEGKAGTHFVGRL